MLLYIWLVYIFYIVVRYFQYRSGERPPFRIETLLQLALAVFGDQIWIARYLVLPHLPHLHYFPLPITFSLTTYPNWGCLSVTGSRRLGAVENLMGYLLLLKKNVTYKMSNKPEEIHNCCNIVWISMFSDRNLNLSYLALSLPSLTSASQCEFHSPAGSRQFDVFFSITYKKIHTVKVA